MSTATVEQTVANPLPANEAKETQDALFSEKLSALLVRERDQIIERIKKLEQAKDQLDGVLKNTPNRIYFDSTPVRKRYRLTTPEWQELVHDYVKAQEPGTRFNALNVFAWMKANGHIPDEVEHPSNSLYEALKQDTDVEVADDTGKTIVFRRKVNLEVPKPIKVRRR